LDLAVGLEVEHIVKTFLEMPFELERLVPGEAGMAADTVEMELERD